MISLEHLSLAISALAFNEVEAKHAKEKNVDKLALYPNLSQNLKGVRAAKVKTPKWFDQKLKAALTEITKSEIVIKNGRESTFSDYWQGKIAPTSTDKPLSPLQRYEQLLYTQGAMIGLNGGIPKSLFTEHFPDVDLDNSDEWCVSLDGNNIISATDYYSGSYAEFKEAHDKAFNEIQDDAHRRRLASQFTAAESRLLKADVTQMEFSINSTMFSHQERCNFLNQYMTDGLGSFRVASTPNGELKIEFKENGKGYGRKQDKINALKRLALYAGGTQNFTSGKKGDEDKRIRSEMKTYLRLANAQFTSWIQADSVKLAKIEAKINDPLGLQFKSVENGEPIAIEGIRESFSPRSHQAAFVRQQARKMSGICGYDVGLGKTFTALLSVQHLQSIGVKNKTIFIVPGSTLTNWRKEAQTVYTDDVMARCLFVGLETDKNGVLSYNSQNVVPDIAKIVENQHDKLFMTYEAFKQISLEDKTVEDYLFYLSQSDATMQFTDSNKKNEVIKSDAAELKKRLIRDMKAKLLEILGVDSLVIDEAHNFKNGKTTNFGQRIRYLSAVQKESNRALDMLIKSWYIRNENIKQTGKNDGILALTATPITNSPLEIYSMLSIAVGEQEVNRLCGVTGQDQFLEQFCLIDTKEERSVDDRDIEVECFMGLRNINLLRKLMNSVATMKTADDLPDKQGYSIPDEETLTTSVPLSAESKEELQKLRRMYQLAKRVEKDDWISPEEEAEVADYAKGIGLPIETVGHAFNFISRQTKAILDKDMSDETSRYYFTGNQAELAQKAVDEFNKKPLIEKDRTNLIGVAEDEIVGSSYKKNSEDESESLIFEVKVIAKLDKSGNKIEFNSTSYQVQSKFLTIAEKLGLSLDVSLSPKLAALVENVKTELSDPKAKGGIAKQVIFTEELGMHQKIRQALIAKCGIPSGKIAIINAEAIPDNAELQDVQDGFNADDADNRYQIVIANKKAEVGINLQKGTQAIHHLDINWTPDSIQQRNGRGVRQGNYLALEGIKVNVYHYEVKGTFDSYKRNVVDKKADWIGQLLYGDSNRIMASQDALTVQQQAELAELTGDEEAMAIKMTEILEENRQKALKSAREDVLLAYKQLNVQQNALKALDTFNGFLDPLYREYDAALKNYGLIFNKLDNSRDEYELEKAKAESDEKGSATANKRLEILNSLQEKIAKLEDKARKEWGVIVHKFNQYDPSLNAENPPLKSGEMANYASYRYADKLKSQTVGQGEAHPLYETYENEKAVKEQLVSRYQAKIDEKLADNSELGLDMERLTNTDKFIFNGLPLVKGDMLEGKEGELVVVGDISHWNFTLYRVINKNGEVMPKGESYIGGSFGETELANYRNLIRKGSQEAYAIYPKLAESDKGLRSEERWSSIIPQVAEFADENEMIRLDDIYGYWDKVELKYLLTYEDFNAVKNTMPLVAKLILKDYEENGVFLNENGYFEAKNKVDLNAISQRLRYENFIAEFALKNGYRLHHDFVRFSTATPGFSNPTRMSHFTTPDLPLIEIEEKLRGILKTSTAEYEDTVALMEQTLVDLGITTAQGAELIVSGFSLSPVSLERENLFTKLSDLYREALNREGRFAETPPTENEANTEVIGDSHLPDWLLITGDTSRNGYDGLRGKVKEAIAQAKLKNFNSHTGVFWCTDKAFDSFQSQNINFFHKNGGGDFKDNVKQHCPRNSWLIHKEVWEALLNFDRDNLNKKGISVRTL